MGKQDARRKKAGPVNGGEHPSSSTSATMPTVAIVGNPNVGKSMTFGNLTGCYTTVSNYPGTTVEVTAGQSTFGGRTYRVVDTPGMYSLTSISEEERVSRKILLEESPETVLHIVDARNIERMLPLCVQMRELGLRVILVLNLMDEVERLGITVDSAALSRELGVRVVEAASKTRKGLAEIKEAIVQASAEDPPEPGRLVAYGDEIEQAASAIADYLPAHLGGAQSYGIALMLLQQDGDVYQSLCEGGGSDEAIGAIDTIVHATGAESPRSLSYAIAMKRQDYCHSLVSRHLVFPAQERTTLVDRVGDLLCNPWTGTPVLIIVMYLGLYKFVGVLGAGVVVDFLENKVFGAYVNPWVDGQLHALLPLASGWHYWVRELIGGDYGIITMGVTYAMAIILPIVSMFFLFFSLLEDSGYFPRLALLVDRMFKKIGLNGRASIPLVVGLGCDTMGTLVTRIQETKRERIITTLLLALAVPCSAQYGLMAGLLAKQPQTVIGVSWAFIAWCVLVALVFLAAGLLASRLVKGEPAVFYMEIPPLRLPHLGNVVSKTLARMKWYFMEIMPLFAAASVLIWIGRLTGVFELLVGGLRPIVQAIGLPASAAEAFLYGFFRRDLGAAGLYQLADAGQLTGGQLLVACVTLTLFLPCVAQLLVMKKERGLGTTAAMASGVVATAFVVGGLVNLAVTATGWVP